MSYNESQFESAVETFANCMSDAEAEAYVAREVLGVGREEAAEYLGKSANTVDNQLQAAREKARLPDISKIETNAQVGVNHDPAVIIWFEPGDRAVRYRWDGEEIREETYFDGVVHEGYGVGGEPDDLAEYALESVSEYVQSYRDDPEAAEADWPHIYELLTA